MYISALCGVLQGEMKGMQMIVYFSVCSSIDIDDSCFVYRNIVLRLIYDWTFYPVRSLWFSLSEEEKNSRKKIFTCVQS